jgi:hypothetical protein
MSTDPVEPDYPFAPAGPPARLPRPPAQSGAAVFTALSLVLSVGALVVCFVPGTGVLGAVCGAAGLIFGVVDWTLARNSRAKTGTGLAKAGTAVGALALVVGLVWWGFLGEKVNDWADKKARDAVPVPIAAADLASAHAVSRDATEARFENRLLEVTGAVFAPAPESGPVVLTLVGAPNVVVSCAFDGRAADVTALAGDQVVTVRGWYKTGQPVASLEGCVQAETGWRPKPKDRPPRFKGETGQDAVSAHDLRRAYDHNPATADAEYKDKALEVRGTVARAPREEPGTVTVALATDRGAEIVCRFAGPAAGALAPGDTAVVRGTGRGVLDGTLTLDSCTLASRVPKPTVAPATSVPLLLLFETYQEDALIGDARYKGKVLQLTGHALRASTDGGIVLELAEGEKLMAVCEFPASAKAQVAGIAPGSVVRLRGTCRGSANGIAVLENCATTDVRPKK